MSEELVFLDRAPVNFELVHESPLPARFAPLISSNEMTRQYFRILSSFVLTPGGFALDRQGGFVPEHHPFGAPRASRLSRVSRFLRQLVLSPTDESDRYKIVFLSHRGWQNNYFHLHVDFLAQALAFRHFLPHLGEPVCLVPRSLPDIGVQAIETFGFEWNYLSDPGAPDRALMWRNGAFMSSHRKAQGKRARDLLDRRVFELFKQYSPVLTSNTSRSKRIIVSRMDASERRLVMDTRTEKLIAREGFQEVMLSGMSYREQIALFSEASHVIAPHGAGLTNVLFSDSARILEIHSPQHGVRPDYYQLSQVGNNWYRGLISRRVDERNSVFLTTDQFTDWFRDRRPGNAIVNDN